jgi:CBS domain-containing protein
MKVKHVIAACAEANTPGIPFCADGSRINGRVTLKNILLKSCLPEFIVEMAMVLGDELSHMQDMGTETRQLLDDPIDTYVQEPHISLTASSPAIKALAMMERNDTSYIFVVDDGRYLGVITIQGLANALLEFDTGT